MSWRDRARKDFKRFGLAESSWYQMAQERGVWRGKCREELETAMEKRVEEDKEEERSYCHNPQVCYSRRQNKVPIEERLPNDFTATLHGSLIVKSLTNSPVERLLKRLYSYFSKQLYYTFAPESAAI